MTRFYIFIVFFTFGLCAEAVKVQSLSRTGRVVTLQNEIPTDWEIDETLCVMRKGDTIACGVVVRSAAKGLLVDVTYQSKKRFKVGQEVILRRTGRDVGSKELSAQGSESLLSTAKTTSVSFGVNILQPLLSIEQAVTNHVSIGFLPAYLNMASGAGSSSGIGIFATASYFSESPFVGLWLMAGFGAYFYTARLEGTPAVEESTSSPAALLVGGWRWAFDSGFHLGIGAGAQYIFKKNLNTIDLKFSGFLPVVLIQAGLTF